MANKHCILLRMANNRLYIYDEVSGDRILIAKSLPLWRLVIGLGDNRVTEDAEEGFEALSSWLTAHDVNAAARGRGSELVILDEAALADRNKQNVNAISSP